MNIEHEIQAALEEALYQKPPKLIAVTLPHPKNKRERAEWAVERAAIEAAGYEIISVGEKPDKPEYQVRFKTHADQFVFLAFLTELHREARK